MPESGKEKNTGRSIIIIDDEVMILQMLCEIIEGAGYPTIGFDNGKDGLAAIKADNPRLIFLDLMLPVMDGFEILDKLKSDDDTKGVPVVIISARRKIGEIDRAFAAGSVGYISKPFDSGEIIKKIKQHALPQ